MGIGEKSVSKQTTEFRMNLQILACDALVVIVVFREIRKREGGRS